MSVAIILGSKSDLPVIAESVKVLKQLNIDYTVSIISAHRDPEQLIQYLQTSKVKVYIAVAGLSAALPGFIASYTLKPVIGVPVSGKVPLDSLLSMVQMPKGVPVAVVGVDNGKNAALLAARILAISDAHLEKNLAKFVKQMHDEKVESAQAALNAFLTTTE